MELGLFTNLIKALGNIAGRLNASVNLAKAERDAIRRTLDESYRLIDTTLKMVIIRLSNILICAAGDDFPRGAARLDKRNEWMRDRREFRQSTMRGRTQWVEG